MSRTTLSSVSITFLGTASAQPSSTRNHSSLALRLNGDIWLFDCGEATQHQIQKSNVKMGSIEKIFITHTHGDHIFGLLPFLASRLNGAGGVVDGASDSRLNTLLITTSFKPLEIYGPPGTRAYIRAGLTYTFTILGGCYVVHELHENVLPTFKPSSLPPHTSELPDGRDFLIDPQLGVWPSIFEDPIIRVSAAPIYHSVPCVGFTLVETDAPGKVNPGEYIPHLKRTKSPMSLMSCLQNGKTIELSDGTVLHGPKRRPGRKIVILGDTYDPSPIAQLATNCDLLIHEATNAHLPSIDPNTKDSDTTSSVEQRARSRGHSTPQMAGRFATMVNARQLLLNHFSARYAGNDDVDMDARKIMEGIRNLAKSEFEGDVMCARDFMAFEVPLPLV